MSDEQKNVPELGAKAEKILDLVSELSVFDLSKLVKAMEVKFGVSAAAPVAVAAAPAAADSSAAEEKSSYQVVLDGAGDNKINVIKAVRALRPDLGLADAKALVESAPKPVLENAPTEKAKEAKKALEEAGAKASLK
ncbi:50S ribosomal protein L7/L12 [candidate division WWE3 bacterium CG08_land_8_20_14_0_20_43_13]|uniref:Large ribosomal subunit protein bL12 n=1 Tax=candidate division WWE3 bacterium CG08_land_8_20_14_0_20_43_13 TaxID=1975087 RepID=A0A2H0X9V3_UNCKA|nr:MAG: 50S ribosomal protein L7/L12 [candidate division WWE3 bacterium CG08_land_8_20_14_0_20_43_13]